MSFNFINIVCANESQQEFALSAIEQLDKLGLQFANVLDALMSIDVTKDASSIASVFNAIGVSLGTFFLCLEVFAYVSHSIDLNGGFESAIRLGMRIVALSVLIDNLGNITSGISKMLKDSISDTFDGSLGSIGDAFAGKVDITSMDDGGFFGINYILLGIFIYMIVVVVFVMFCKITIDCMQLTFETAILSIISPIALSTLLNSTMRSTGIGFIKAFTAVNLQWGIISVCFALYSPIQKLVTEKMVFADGGFFGVFADYFGPILCLTIVGVMIKKSGEIARRALGA